MENDKILTDEELTYKVGMTVEQIAQKTDYWVRISKPHLPKLYFNVYCFIDYGNLGEIRIGTATIRYNGDVHFSSHL